MNYRATTSIAQELLYALKCVKNDKFDFFDPYNRTIS